MSYQPGTHIISTLHTSSAEKLVEHAAVKQLLDKLIIHFSLEKLGEVYHNFPGGGFTATVCLSESHLSIHTWPEYMLVNMDIYLSNYQRNNDGTVEAVFDALKTFFEATTSSKQTIRR